MVNNQKKKNEYRELTGERYTIPLTSIIELVLMRRGNTKYNLVVAKLRSLYDLALRDCDKHPKYLKKILKEVYKEEYGSIISEIKLGLDELIKEKEFASFIKIMES
ncbi:MAG TPA: hypothetical protein VEU72_00905 [Nitrosopumilaceae archaeon]|nr:hypothetical protein [Nitrosopumilaceae archaeon]